MGNPKGYRVYVIEDDLELSTVIGRVLRSLDSFIELEWATSTEEAMSHLKELRERSDDRPFDLIVADIFLEGASTGLDLWRFCKLAYPDLPFLVTSGMPAEQVYAEIGRHSAGPAFLPKPFSIADCSQILDELLRQGQVARPF